MTDLDRYKDMLARADEPFEERADSGQTVIVSGRPEPGSAQGQYYAVFAVFNQDGSLKALNPDGCTWDCSHCR